MTPDSSAILALAIYAAVAVAVTLRQFRRSGLTWGAWILYVVERTYVALMFQWRSNRRCPFPASGPAIIIANHRGPLDPMFLWMNNHLGRTRRPTRIIGFMTASEYCELPVLGWICRHMQSIPVERDGKDIKPAKAALDRLMQGHLLGVFPEGGINTGEGIKEADPGIAWLALRARVPIFPVYIENSPGGDSMVRPFFTPSRVRVHYGDPIILTDYAGRTKTRALLTEVTDLLMRRLANLGGVRYAKDVTARPVAEVISAPLRSIRPTG